MSRIDELTWAVDDAVLAIARLLATQEYGHTSARAEKSNCGCRWCEAHRFILDHANDVQFESRKTFRELLKAIERNGTRLAATKSRAIRGRR